jgi:hypothetical protein
VIEIWRGRGEIWVHNTKLPINATTGCCVVARTAPGSPHTYTVFVDTTRGEWRLEGDAQASGTMIRQ